MKSTFEVPVPADQQLSLAPLGYVGLGIVGAVVASFLLGSNGVPTLVAVLAPISLVVLVVAVLASRGASKARRQYQHDLEVFLTGIKEATGGELVTNGQTVNFNDLPEYAVVDEGNGYSRWDMKKDGTKVTFKKLDKNVQLPR